MVESRRDRGLHLPLVRRAPAPELRHGRGPRDATRRRASSTRSALAALIQAMVKELCEHFEAGEQLARLPVTRCSTRTSGWPPATASTASSSTCPRSERVGDQGARPAAARPPARARPGPRLGRRARRRSTTCSSTATAPPASSSSTRPTTTCARSWREIVGATGRAAARARARRAYLDSRAMSPEPDLFVVCKNCGSEVSPYITECPYCGQRLRKRAPKLERDGAGRAEARARRGAGAVAAAAAPRRDPGHPRRRARPYATIALVLAALGVLPAGRGERRRPRRPRRVDRRRSTATGGGSSRRRSSTTNVGYLFAALVADRDLRLAARAPLRPVVAAARLPRRRRGGHVARERGRRLPARDGRQRRRARRCCARGRCATCATAGAARTPSATCSACVAIARRARR